jgi:predicted Zn-dependent protease
MDTTFSPPSGPTGRAQRWVRGLCVVLPLSFAATTFAASEPSLITGQKKSFGYSWQQELKLGAEADKEIMESMGLYDDPKVQAYVEAVGQRVLQQSNFNSPNAPEIYRNTKFTFRVMDSSVVNAFALPGGYVYVTRGLLAHVQNEAQLGVVLGHEIGHVAARHSSQQARRSQWTQLGVVAGAILGQKVLGEKGGNIAPALINAGGQAAQMFLLRYSREAEFEADNLGMNYAMRSGYAADQSARFFQSLQRISAAEGKTLPTWQSTHPDPGDRAQRVLQLASAIPADTRTNVGEEQFIQHVEGMIVGDDPRQGFASNGIFYHPELRFQLPVAAGWKLDNQRAAVVFAEPNGQAMMGLRLAPGSRARDAAMQFAQQSKVQIVTSGDTMVNGLPTTVIIGQATTDEGTVGVWNAFIELDSKVYSLIGYAPQQAFEQVRPTFESVAAGFSPLRDMSIASVQPARLKIVRADRSGPFASFVPTSLPQDITPDEIAIMNQVTLNDTIPQGRLLKVPDVPPQPRVAPQGQVATTNYPDNRQQNYPNRYPPQTGYPQQPGYPPQSQPSNYPQQSAYPAQNPQQTGRYPQTDYPQQYPQQSGYPQSSTYPPSQNYPQNYPQPGGTNYPPQPTSAYPQQPATNYPQYPQQQGTNYPAQQNYPQFPQPPGATNTQNRTQQQQQQSQPSWPR